MTTWPILSVVTFLPIVGALLIYVVRADDETAKHNARWIALWTTLITFGVSLILVWRFDPAQPDFQFVEKTSWLASGITYHMGVDGISLPFVILTTALMPFCIVASWKSVKIRVREYMTAFLLLETLMVGTFSALDLVVFYLFFEGSLIPMFLIIGVWGGPRRVYASFKFFLYTLLGSVLMLLAIMALYWNAGTTDIPILMHTAVPRSLQTWAWLAFFASFSVKMPMWPVHTWLPDAHVEAPTAGSVILAAVLMKMGGYGFLRFSLPMFPLASHDFAPLIFSLSVIAIIYTSLVALMQEDMKKLIAYTSVAHMGVVTMGVFAGTLQGVAGGIFQMISHGIVSGALFLCVGIVYDRMHTREIAAYGGLVNRMPLYALVFMVFTMANVGLPGTSGFVGEFLTLIGTFKASPPTAVFATTGVILSACYALWLYRKVVFGALVKPSLASIKDLTARECLTLMPLVVLTVLLGFYPQPVLDISAASAQRLVDNYNAAVTAALLPGPNYGALREVGVLTGDERIVLKRVLFQTNTTMRGESRLGAGFGGPRSLSKNLLLIYTGPLESLRPPFNGSSLAEPDQGSGCRAFRSDQECLGRYRRFSRQ
jgi:NADH-quinone oxidoreductase subunit M